MKEIFFTQFKDEWYEDFIDYCIDNSDSFMLVYVRYQREMHYNTTQNIKDSLKPYMIKKRTNPSWPGTPSTYCRNTQYEVIFYKCCEEIKEELLKASNLFEWNYPFLPQDLAFFRGNECWFYSTAHEKIATVLNLTETDISFFEKLVQVKASDVNRKAIYEEGLT